jgi:peptide chain release factor subunit 1
VIAITEDAIRSLAGFKGDGAPVTSCYVDIDGSRHLRWQDVVHAVQPLLRDAHVKHAQEPSVLGDLQRIEELVKGGVDRRRTRGLAIFSCTADDFWQVVELPVPVRNQLVVNHSPAVRQLEVVIDEFERFGLLLADRQRARVLVYELGELVESDEVFDALPRDQDHDNSHRPEKVQAHRAESVHAHLRKAAETAFRVFKDRGFERLIIAAPDDIANQLESVLHPYLQERVEARCAIPVTASDDEIRAAALDVEAAVERRKEAEAVTRLRDEVGAGGRGVAGLDDTLRALVERRVDVLLVSSGFTHEGWRCNGCSYVGRIGRTCPVCSTTMVAVDDVVEEAIEEALAQSCEVEVCERNADLDVLGRIGALLRY